MVDPRGVPDLRQFTKPARTYLAMHHEALRDDSFEKRVTASWGLIARGAESVPLLVELLSAPDARSREDAAGALAWLGRSDPSVVPALVHALNAATEHEDRDAIIVALGALRSREAVPALAAVIRSPGTDEDTRWTAIQALGRIVRRRFDRQPDPHAAATTWLDAHHPPAP